MADERIEVQRTITADPQLIFQVLCDPRGHVAIDSSGMLMSAEGDPVAGVGDTFVVHMDREALNDYPLGKYDVTVQISAFEPDREIAWTILSVLQPPIGHVYGYRLEVAEGAGGAEGRPPADSAAPDGEQTKVTSYYDWSDIHPQWREAGIFPILSEGALRATLGILDRTVRRGYPRP
jgi:hypothetical protein